MADSAAFEFVCEKLEQRSTLDRLAARGTVRLALKQAGLAPRTSTPAQMVVVCEKILLSELEARGVEDRAAILSEMISGLGALRAEAVTATPDAVFQRLGGD